MPRVIGGIEEFLAHAMAIEREAAGRYREFEAHFREHDKEILAGLCANLAALEEDHLGKLLDEARGRTLPAIDSGRYRWLESEAPEAVAREVFHRLVDEQQLLEIALQAECRAQRFFAWVALSTPDDSVRRLALEMAEEEADHARWVLQALEYRLA